MPVVSLLPHKILFILWRKFYIADNDKRAVAYETNINVLDNL